MPEPAALDHPRAAPGPHGERRSPTDHAATGSTDDQAVSRHPPRARLTLRVGVTGHRPNRLVEAELPLLHERVRDVLRSIAVTVSGAARTAGDAYRPAPPVLRLISPLAEGADRIVAQEALDLGYELQCPLPFPRDEYERDFRSTAARDEYRSLLEKATAVLELDGSRDSPQSVEDAYEAVGRMMLDQCDVLLAVWDGDAPFGSGGTARVVQLALRAGMIVVWVDAKPEHESRLLAQDASGATVESPVALLDERIVSLLLPPATPAAPHADSGAHRPRPDLRTTYFAERAPRPGPLAWVWPLFRDLVADARLTMGARYDRDLTRATATAGAMWESAPPFPAEVPRQIDASVRDHYVWAVALADHYSAQHRGAFVSNYLLGALVVFLALIGLPLDWPHHAPDLERSKNVISVAVIGLVLVTYWRGRHERWHERWIDYRPLSELLRQLRFLAPIGRIPPFFRQAGREVQGDPRATWMAWHLRAVAREAGMVSARLTPEYRRAYHALIRENLVADQCRYHERVAERLGRLDRRLRRAGLILFAGALLALLAQFILHQTWFTLMEAVFPALGGALAAIRGQAELERSVHRSAAMAGRLREIGDELAGLSDPSVAALAGVAEATAEAMVAQELDWRSVFQARPLELSG